MVLQKGHSHHSTPVMLQVKDLQYPCSEAGERAVGLVLEASAGLTPVSAGQSSSMELTQHSHLHYTWNVEGFRNASQGD